MAMAEKCSSKDIYPTVWHGGGGSSFLTTRGQDMIRSIYEGANSRKDESAVTLPSLLLLHVIAFLRRRAAKVA